MGNRIAKLIKDGSDSLVKATYYVRDAQGNVMTVYQWQIKDTLPEHIAAERYIYGSSRLGVETTPVEMIGAMPQTQDTAVRILQYKHYEISNHLGNVLAVVSDKKVLKDTDQNMMVDEYHPDMVSANDYSPFGVYLYGRTWSAGGYRYGFNGMEKDDEIHSSFGSSYDYGNRLYDPRIGRWNKVDNLAYKYPTLTPYGYAANGPILYVDIDGDDFYAHGKKNQRQVMRVLNQTFGKDHGFSFNNSGELIHNGINFNGNYEQNLVYDHFKQKIVDNDKSKVTFRGFGLEWIRVDGNTYELDPGDAATVQRMKGDVLHADIGIAPGVKNSLSSEGVKSSKASAFWHEMGHPIATINNDYNFSALNRAYAAKWTVAFENVVRIIFNMDLRSGSDHGAQDRNGNVIPGSEGTLDSIDNFDVRPGAETDFDTPNNVG